MSNLFWSRLLLGVAVVAAAGTSTPVLAEETQTINALEGQATQTSTVHLTPVMATEAEQSEGQVTSVSQLSDVQPTDWAFQALQSLVERYGCIAGYPDSTFKGKRAATRYEMAAALNACLDQISDRFATKEDLEAVKALQEEFKAELATLKGRVDGLEARTATLEAQQFSTTTKLKGEAIFLATQVFDGDGADTRAVFADRARLNFDTSFTGKDQLRVRLQARNIQENDAASGTDMTRTSVDGDDGNTFTLDDLYYKFPIGKKAKVTAFAKSADFYSQVNTYNPFLASDGTGSISRFGRFNPIYRLSERGTSAGLILNYKFTDKIGASVGYIGASAANSVGPTGGLFGGSYTALAQLDLQPTKNFGFGVAYAHTFQEEGLVSLSAGTGSSFSSNPFSNAGSDATNADSVGLQFTWQVVPKFNISGWAGYTKANYDGDNPALQGAEADIINWSAQFAFPDLFMKGNLGAIIVGQQPYVFNENFATAGDPDSNFHIEGLYRFQINDNISVTPGVIVIVNPENNSANDTDFVPVIRTTFTF